MVFFLLFAGHLFDYYKSYDVPFYVMGSLEFVGGFVYLFVAVVHGRRSQTEDEELKHVAEKPSEDDVLTPCTEKSFC